MRQDIIDELIAYVLNTNDGICEYTHSSSIEDEFGEGYFLGGEDVLDNYHNYIVVEHTCANNPLSDIVPDAIYVATTSQVTYFFYELR